MIKTIELLKKEDGEWGYSYPINKNDWYVLRIELWCKIPNKFKISITSTDFLIKGNNTKIASNTKIISFRVQPIKTKKEATIFIDCFYNSDPVGKIKYSQTVI